MFLDLFINNFYLHEKIKTLATKTELKTEKDKIEKLQTYDSSLFVDQSYFMNNGSQNFLIFQPIINTFTILAGNTDTIVEC